jgi:hypothetical protein
MNLPSSPRGTPTRAHAQRGVTATRIGLSVRAPSRFDLERVRAAAGSRGHFATRSTYSWVRVSILMVSPIRMNSGTLTVAPVSRVAGF